MYGRSLEASTAFEHLIKKMGQNVRLPQSQLRVGPMGTTHLNGNHCVVSCELIAFDPILALTPCDRCRVMVVEVV